MSKCLYQSNQETKKLEEFSEVEKGIYIFENRITNDMIKLKGHNRVVAMLILDK